MGGLAYEVLGKLKRDLQVDAYHIERSLFRIGSAIVNIRTTRGLPDSERFWFDGTPSLYEQGPVDYVLFACGSANSVYVIPAAELARMIEDANLCGAKRAPNFNIHLDSDELVPCGTGRRYGIADYFNDFSAFGASPARPA